MTAASNPQEFLRARVFADPNSGCWLWEKAVLPDGYGQCSVAGHPTRTHRLAYTAFVGPIPAGLSVLHKCDVPACINPSHLFVGTQQDNMIDAGRKGRIFLQRSPEKSWLWGHGKFGELSPRAKLSAAAVADIQSRQDSTKTLMQRYAVSKSTIDRIRAGHWGKPLSEHVRTGQKRASSGHQGVFWHKLTSKWMAGLRIGGRQMYLGLHETKEAAIAAVETARRNPGRFNMERISNV